MTTNYANWACVDWNAVQAVLTLGGLLVACWAAWKASAAAKAAWKTLEIERERDARAREQERLQQASRVYVEVVYHHPKGFNNSTWPRAILTNSSDLPIYPELIEFVRGHEKATAAVAHPPSLSPADAAITAIGEDAAMALGLKVSEGGRGNRYIAPPPDDEPFVAAGAIFRDAAGVRWKRDEHGQLAELSSTA